MKFGNISRGCGQYSNTIGGDGIERERMTIVMFLFGKSQNRGAERGEQLRIQCAVVAVTM